MVSFRDQSDAVGDQTATFRGKCLWFVTIRDPDRGLTT